MITILLKQIIDLLTGWISSFTQYASDVLEKLGLIEEDTSYLPDIKSNTDDIKDNTAAVITPINNIKSNTDAINTSSATTASNTTAITSDQAHHRQPGHHPAAPGRCRTGYGHDRFHPARRRPDP